jgi:hypothetical protein
MPFSADGTGRATTQAWRVAAILAFAATFAATFAGCRSRPRATSDAPAIEPAPVAVCASRRYAVRATESAGDGVGRFVASASDCRAVRDSIGLAVLDRLLFVGVPNSPQAQPMLDRPEALRETPTAALRDLRAGGWSQFLLRWQPTDDHGELVEMDLVALRRWLTTNHLARKFGLP